jgi:selenoprotein W-related protein
LAAAIKKASGVDAKLIGGAGGIFDVQADGKVIFSKHETGRFPEDAEIIEVLAPQRK